MNVNQSHPIIKNPEGFQTRLLKWFRKHRRPLPWRTIKKNQKPDPYHIFVVEVMLQQTQMKTVLPYFERWLKAFPTVQSLARAPMDRILKLWEGLGYYSRARNLHKAAQIIVDRFGGQIPDHPETLCELPGIGRYTAGAIASIAFHKPAPLVDGNVMRVLSRLFNIRKDISQSDTQKSFYEIAGRIISTKDPGSFNQALMELGSLVCIPDMPRCHLCPVHNLCMALKNGDPSMLPVRRNKPTIKTITIVTAIIFHKDRLLVRKRPARGIWGGLWELPSAMPAGNESCEETLRQELSESIGINVKIGKNVQPIKHALTHRHVLLKPFLCQVTGKCAVQASSQARWANNQILESLSFPVPYQKIIGGMLQLHGLRSK